MVQMYDHDTPPLAAGGGRGKMRASDTDRDRVVEHLNVAYSEGRLSKDEYDGRLEKALFARTCADLDQIVADLPAHAPAVVPLWPGPTGSRWRASPARSRSSRSAAGDHPGDRVRPHGPAPDQAHRNRELAWRSRA